MRINTKILIGSISLVAIVGLGSCTADVTCGTGTIEKDGECVADGTPIHGNCGAGSLFNPATMQCEIPQCAGGAPCGICGDNTVPETDANGVTTCIGTGGPPIGCDSDLACPPAGAGRQMICGRLVDTETGANVEGDDLPTTVSIGFYEALAFANNPGTPPEFTVNPDTCGRYVSVVPGHDGVAVPGTMFILVGTDDIAMPGPAGAFITTGIALAGVPGAQAKKVNTYLTAAATNEHWSTSAGVSPTFVEQGVYMSIFKKASNGAPVPGVTLTFEGNPDAAHDYYFSDTTPLLRSMVGTGNVTGADGAVLFLSPSPGDLSTFNGSGPTGCDWGAEGTLGTTIVGTVFVQERTGMCP